MTDKPAIEQPQAERPARHPQAEEAERWVGLEIAFLQDRAKDATTEEELYAIREEMIREVDEYISLERALKTGIQRNRDFSLNQQVRIVNGKHKGKIGTITKDYDDGYVEVQGDGLDWDIHVTRLAQVPNDS